MSNVGKGGKLYMLVSKIKALCNFLKQLCIPIETDFISIVICEDDASNSFKGKVV